MVAHRQSRPFRERETQYFSLPQTFPLELPENRLPHLALDICGIGQEQYGRPRYCRELAFESAVGGNTKTKTGGIICW